MIKCFIVECMENINKGNFDLGGLYIAKISNNDHNVYSVLDKNKNWVPFNCYGPDSYKKYFNEFNIFYIENKKEMNKYIEESPLY